MNKNITIDARRWFQTTYGNTYHSVSVFVNNKLVGSCPFAYGYGEQYLQTAHEILQNAEVYPKTGERLNGCSKDYHEFVMDMRENKERFHVTCTDVTRKRDL